MVRPGASSWDGFCEHTRQGWNVGRSPYGYVADKIPHSVPARGAERITKSRLVPDPLIAPVVHQIFMWRVVDRLGYAEITDRLNTDLDRYPSPVSPDPARQRDYWSRYWAREILLNPKYTGYMVRSLRTRVTSSCPMSPRPSARRSPEAPNAPPQLSTSGRSTVRYNSDFDSIPMPGSSCGVT